MADVEQQQTAPVEQVKAPATDVEEQEAAPAEQGRLLWSFESDFTAN